MQIKILTVMLIATNCLMGAEITPTDKKPLSRRKLTINYSDEDLYSDFTPADKEQITKKVKKEFNPEIINDQIFKFLDTEPQLNKESKDLRSKLLRNCDINHLEEILKRPELLKLSDMEFGRLLKLTTEKSNVFHDFYELILEKKTLLNLEEKQFERIWDIVQGDIGQDYTCSPLYDNFEVLNRNQTLLNLEDMQFQRLIKLMVKTSSPDRANVLKLLSDNTGLLSDLEFDRVYSVISAMVDSDLFTFNTNIGCPNVSGVIEIFSKSPEILSPEIISPGHFATILKVIEETLTPVKK